MSHISALQFRVSSPQTYKSKHLFGNFILQHKLVYNLLLDLGLNIVFDSISLYDLQSASCRFIATKLSVNETKVCF